MSTIASRIDPKQMAAWVEKLEANMEKALKDDSMDKAQKLVFIRHQYALLNTIIKVLNGDTFFVGCSQTPTN